MGDSASASDREGTTESVGVAVVTVSGSLPGERDDPADSIATAFDDGGHEIVTREKIENGYDNVQSRVSNLLDRDDVDVVVATGGTGIGPDDVTLEAIDPLIDKELPAFADMFHRVLYEEIGTRAICTRTLCGVADGVPIFCLPDEVESTRLATESIVVPEAPTIVARAATVEADEEPDE